MKLFKAYGYSDDNFAFDLGGTADEISCYDEEGYVKLRSSEGLLEVFGYYNESGCWGIGVRSVSEGVPIPTWPTEYHNKHEYSVMIVLQVPDDTEVFEMGTREAR